MESIPMRLFKLRRRIEKALAALTQVGLERRRIRLFERDGGAYLGADRERIFVREFRAAESIVQAGIALFDLTAEIDRALNLEQRLDLLGAARRGGDITPEFESFSCLVGAKLEEPLSRDDRRNTLSLWIACSLASCPDTIAAYPSTKAQVEALERRHVTEKIAADERAAALNQAMIATRIEANGGYVFDVPTTLQ